LAVALLNGVHRQHCRVLALHVAIAVAVEDFKLQVPVDVTTAQLLEFEVDYFTIILEFLGGLDNHLGPVFNLLRNNKDRVETLTPQESEESGKLGPH